MFLSFKIRILRLKSNFPKLDHYNLKQNKVFGKHENLTLGFRVNIIGSKSISNF